MEVRIKEGKEEIKYPCLMESNDKNLIVLFTANCVGTVVRDNDMLEIGYHSSDWNMINFSKFQGTLELSN